jgi:hypothetical protein
MKSTNLQHIQMIVVLCELRFCLVAKVMSTDAQIRLKVTAQGSVIDIYKYNSNHPIIHKHLTTTAQNINAYLLRHSIFPKHRSGYPCKAEGTYCCPC